MITNKILPGTNIIKCLLLAVNDLNNKEAVSEYEGLLIRISS